VKLLRKLLASNSFWLGVINILINLTAVTTPLYAEYPKTCLIVNVISGTLFVLYKAMQNTVAEIGDRP
jgi:hypothetical protein